MSRIETIRTKVRPIKKLFIVEEDDVDAFFQVVGFVTGEVMGLSNLILLNDEGLASDNVLGFVDRHRPDVLLNLSSADTEKLRGVFKLPALSCSVGDGNFQCLSTRLCLVDNLPRFLKVGDPEGAPEVFSCFGEEAGPDWAALSLNFGMVGPDLEEELKESVWEHVRIRPIQSVEQMLDLTKTRGGNLLHMSLDLAALREESSVWHLNHNPHEYFRGKPTLVIGDRQRLRSMSYFWNTRATHPYNTTVWLPAEAVERHQHQLGGFQHCCLFTDDEGIARLVSEMGIGAIDHSVYWFQSHTTGWSMFQSTQVVSVVDGRLRISHPADKLLSTSGWNVGFALDVVGIPEFWTPRTPDLGEQFVELPDRQLFPRYFAKVDQGTLSRYGEQIAFLEDRPVVEEIRLPGTEAVLSCVFAGHGLELRATPATKVANQTIELLGGHDGIGLLADERVLQLLVKLTPPRRRRLAESLASAVGSESEAGIREVIARCLPSLETRGSQPAWDVQGMTSLVGGTKEQQAELFATIQDLYGKRVLLRGKSFPCPHCGSDLWYPLASLQEENRCDGCNKPVGLPIFSQQGVLGDHFRLNQLVANAVDQGVLPVLLTIHLLDRQPFAMRRFVANHEVYETGGENRLAEVDLVFALSDKLGLAEVKADSGFDLKQTNRLIDLARRVECGLLVFATLKAAGSAEVAALVDHLRGHDLRIPAFIVTSEALFAGAPPHIDRHFRVILNENRFPCGPILVQKAGRDSAVSQ